MKGETAEKSLFCRLNNRTVKIASMIPIIGQIGPFVIYSFTAVLGLGFLAGTGLVAWQNRELQISEPCSILHWYFSPSF